MADQDAFALGQSDLNGFLFADVGIDGGGMPLSVVSVLARLDLDPWQEAGRLAKLPRATAADGLARRIAALPASLWPMPEATRIANRLVALLPGQDARPAEAAANLVGLGGGSLLVAAVVAVMVMAVVAARLPAAPEPTTAARPPITAPVETIGVPTNG